MAISRRNAYIQRAFQQLVLQLRNPFDTVIFLLFTKPSESTRNVSKGTKGSFVIPRLTRGVGLCVRMAVRHNKVGAYISFVQSVSSLFFQPILSDATRHDDTLHLVYPRGQEMEETVRNRGRNKKGSGNISTNPRAHTRRSFCENSNPRAVYFVKTWEARWRKRLYVAQLQPDRAGML